MEPAGLRLLWIGSLTALRNKATSHLLSTITATLVQSHSGPLASCAFGSGLEILALCWIIPLGGTT